LRDRKLVEVPGDERQGSGRPRWHPRVTAEQHGEDVECIDLVFADGI